jgi:hypothetical protein
VIAIAAEFVVSSGISFIATSPTSTGLRAGIGRAATTTAIFWSDP